VEPVDLLVWMLLHCRYVSVSGHSLTNWERLSGIPGALCCAATSCSEGTRKYCRCPWAIAAQNNKTGFGGMVGIILKFEVKFGILLCDSADIDRETADQNLLLVVVVTLRVRFDETAQLENGCSLSSTPNPHGTLYPPSSSSLLILYLSCEISATRD
jgi:hypothetical protein